MINYDKHILMVPHENINTWDDIAFIDLFCFWITTFVFNK